MSTSYRYYIHVNMARFYISVRNSKKAIGILKKIEDMDLANCSSVHFPFVERDMNNLYLSSYEIARDWDKWLSLRKKIDGLEGRKVLPKEFIMLVASKEQYSMVKKLIQPSEKKSYCWLDVMILIKKYKYKEAKELLVSSLSKCNKKLVSSVYLDFLDLSQSVKSKRRRWYIRKIIRDVFKK